MQKKKSGVKKCLEILPLRGGGVGPLMANAIKNFHFDYLKPSLSEKDQLVVEQSSKSQAVRADDIWRSSSYLVAQFG